jgi:sugar lactone lactonase YvrE
MHSVHKKFASITTLLTAIAAAALVVACGGGGSDGTAGGGAPTPVQPTGPTLVILAGSVSDSGNLDGNGTTARFFRPLAIASDQAGNLYVADSTNYSIRKLTQAGIVTTLAAPPVLPATTFAGTLFVGQMSGIALDSSGTVYLSDSNHGTVIKVSASGTVSDFAGPADLAGSTMGAGANLTYHQPNGVAVDAQGNVYASGGFDNTIRKVTPVGVASIFAGVVSVTQPGSADGLGSSANFGGPTGLATDSAGNLYVADTGNNTIRKITPGAVVSTLAGKAGVTGSADGTGAAASFNAPSAVAVDSAGDVYVADTGNNTIRKITPTGVVTTVAGVAGKSGFVGGALPGGLVAPNGLAVVGTSLYITTGNAIAVINQRP